MGGDYLYNLATASTAACVAEGVTLPIDTAKVRLQLQGVSGTTDKPKYRGMVGTLRTVAKEEGVSALWKGLVPGFHRQIVFGGLRIGMYEPIKGLFVGKDHTGPVPLYLKIAASLTTGAGAIMIASPTDLVKVRMQAEGKLPAGTPKRYPTAMGAYRKIVLEEGVSKLWTGLGPNVVRNSVINAAELATYDQIKETLLASGAFQDNVTCHLTSAVGAAVCATTIGSPVDVVKSRMMGSGGQFSSTLDCFVKTFRNEGPLAFYRGYVSNFSRIGSWNVVMFLTLEQIRKLIKQE